jgi:hypothetical protein
VRHVELRGIADKRTTHRCAACGAAGYRRQAHNPFNHRRVVAETVYKYNCPSCHGPTRSPKTKCPDCIKKSNGKWIPTIKQKEALATLAIQEGPAQLSISGATLGVLRKKGMVRQVVCWEITGKGRALLTGSAHNQEENDEQTDSHRN